MVVQIESLDLGYLGFFLGLRVQELVVAELREAGFDVRESHGFVVQHLIERDRTVTELASRMEVTQQAASKTVAEMVRLGLIETAPSEQDGRSKRIRLSERGWASVRLARESRAAIAQRLETRLKEDRHTAARAALIDCLRELGAEDRIETRRVRRPR